MYTHVRHPLQTSVRFILPLTARFRTRALYIRYTCAQRMRVNRFSRDKFGFKILILVVVVAVSRYRIMHSPRYKSPIGPPCRENARRALSMVYY